jgi:hypothetical protein
MAGQRGRRSRQVRIGRTRVGKGIFAQRWYRPQEIVGEIEGAIIGDEHYGSDYCINIGDSGCLEPDPPFRYVNHSCEPNCEFDWYDMAEATGTLRRRRVFLFALRVIRPHEELTIDYNWPAAAAIPCRCNSPFCRGWIVAEEELAKIQADSCTSGITPVTPDRPGHQYPRPPCP